MPVSASFTERSAFEICGSGFSRDAFQPEPFKSIAAEAAPTKDTRDRDGFTRR